jgi:hypothetical protein
MDSEWDKISLWIGEQLRDNGYIAEIHIQTHRECTAIACRNCHLSIQPMENYLFIRAKIWNWVGLIYEEEIIPTKLVPCFFIWIMNKRFHM